MKPAARLLIPALNEAENLPRLLEELPPQLDRLDRPWQILFVDDGSTDRTVEVIREASSRLPVSVVSHPRNLGPGAAFMTGFRTLLADMDDQAPIVTLEADTTSDASLLPTLLSRFDGGADVVLASVYHPDGGMRNTPAHRKVLSQGANALMQAAFRMPGIHTFSSFYRVYRAGLLRSAVSTYGDRLMEEPGFAAVVELLVKLQRQGARIEEVPMILDSARRKGASRMKIARTIRAYLRLMAKLSLDRPPSPAFR